MKIRCMILAGALATALAGCASSGNGQIEALTQERAAAALIKGHTTREEVRHSLGDALVTAFPDGREVWFYEYSDSPVRLLRYVPVVGRLSETGTAIKELKILFDRDGRVVKFRLQDIHVQ